MDVTTQDIMAYRKEIRADIQSGAPYILQIEEEIQDAEDFQVDAVGKRSSICSPKLADKIETHIDVEKMYSEMGTEFLNYDYMRAAGCSVYSTFHGMSEASGDISRLARLKHEVRNLHKFGGESAYGYALTGGLDGVDNAFVVKTARTEAAQADLTHELFVGLFALNKLRKIIPNFAMIFGGFKCSKAVINKDTGEVESYCGTSVGQIPYVIYENISPSKSFGDVSLKCTVPKFYSLLFQHLFATHIASELVGYTHYDCHPGNCLDREVHIEGIEGKFCIPYTDPKTKSVSYVEADSILTYIDYGMTAVTVEGVAVGAGSIRLEEYGVSSGPWPLHDVYKLLGFTAQSLIHTRSNPKVLEEIRKIFTFFNKSETLEQAISSQAKFRTYFSLPKMQKTEGFTIYDLIQHVLRVGQVGDIVSREPRHPILECTSCHSFSATIEGSYVKNPVPTNFLDFYDIAKHLGSASKMSYDQVVNSFDYPAAAVEFKKMVNKSTSEMNDHLLQEHLPELARMPSIRDLTNKKIYEESQQAYFELVSAISHYEDLRMWLALGNSVAILFQDQDMIRFINDNRESLKEVERDIVARINEIREFYRKISAVVTSKEWNKYNERYPWYRVNSGEIMFLREKFQNESNLFVEQRLPSTIIRRSERSEKIEGRRSERRSKKRKESPKKEAVLNGRETSRRDSIRETETNHVGVLPQKRKVVIVNDRDGMPARLDVAGF